MVNPDELRLPGRGPRRLRTHLWRQWCFLRVVGRHVGLRLLVLAALLLGGGLLFQVLEPEKRHTLPRAMYYTFSLVFAQGPEDFPASPVLQVLFFIVPLAGLLVILEALVDCALLLRDRRRNERSWYKVMAASLSNHIILVGLGKLGYRTFRLLRQMGETVVVIERNTENQFLEDIRRDGSLLFVGDARREAFLEDAHAARARSIIAATNHDLTNLEIALDARRINPNIRVVLRMFDQNMADKIREGFNMQVAMSQSAISAPAFALASVEESIVSSLVLEDELLVVQRFCVAPGSGLAGKTVAQVMTEFGVGVIQHRPRDGAPRLMPVPETRLAAGDEVLLQGAFDALGRLRAALDEAARGARVSVPASE